MALRLNIILCTLVALLLTGCYEEDVVAVSTAEPAATTRQAYISLTFAMPSKTATRSTTNPPMGGEWGDGREIGQDYENTVTTAAVFLYQDEKGVNGSAATPVTLVYFDSVDGEQNYSDNIDYFATTAARPVDLELGHYNVLAIANPRDLSWAQGNGLTLGDVRDHIETAAWTEGNDGTYTSFLMTSENEGYGIDITAENTHENPAKASVDVERMAARVDYQASGTFTITADDGDSNYTGATVTITGAAIVNNLTAGSYLLKRVNTGLGSTVTYLGEEIADETTSIATNYVIDPWTEEKDGTSEEVTIDGVKSPISNLYGVYYPGIATDGDEQNPSYWDTLVTAGTPITVDGQTWNRIGYTMENTTYDTYTNKKYNTGAVFAATFTPAEGTVVDSFYDGFSYDYTNHATFFKWNEVLYATAEDMMAVAYPSYFVAGDMFGGTTFANISTIEDLQAFAETLRDDDPTGYKAYLETITTFPTSISDLYWVNYMATYCGYMFNNGVTISETTRAALSAATDEEVSTYENAQCYYTWWIRHSNDDSDETNGIMEYAIVRNNIYKLQVTSVYSIGGDIPREGLRVHVYVKNWTMYDPEVIDL